jgi:hypothetical protein
MPDEHDDAKAEEAATPQAPSNPYEKEDEDNSEMQEKFDSPEKLGAAMGPNGDPDPEHS